MKLQVSHSELDFESLPISVQQVLEKLEQKNIPFSLVGGFVRDLAGGCPSHRDIDIAACASVARLQAILGGKLIRGRHPLVKLGGCEVLAIPDLEQDLLRRDLTCNALAITGDGRLLDPFGGVYDAQNHILRMTAPGIFLEDPIRILRLCRLAARLCWEIDPPTRKAAISAARSLNRQDLFRQDSLRVGLELIKALRDPEPSRFFRFTHDLEILPLVFPGLERWFNQGREEELDNFLEACDQANPGRHDFRIAALLQKIAPSDRKGRSRKSAGIARNFLLEIKWDIITTKMEGYRARLHSAAIAASIRYQGIDFASSYLEKGLIASLAKIPGFTIDQMLDLRKYAFGEEVTHEYRIAAKTRLRKVARNKSLSTLLRQTAQQFAGINSPRRA